MSHIASAVGIPLYADTQTEQGTRLKFARICVEIDASKPLTEEIYLKPCSTNTTCPASIIEIKALYLWKPKQCSGCQVLGHTDITCPKQAAFSASQAPGHSQSAGISSGLAGKLQNAPSTLAIWRIAI